MAGFAKVAPAARAENFFERLGVEPRYDLDLDDLERRYLERSKQVHPDRFVGRPAAERVAAMSQSMDLNKAYKALRKPVSRAEHLLELRGRTIGHNETLEPQFLMEVLEAREELAEAKMEGDAATVARLRREMESREQDALERIGAAFSGYEQQGDASLLDAIKRDLILMRYTRRYLEAASDEDGAEGA